MVLLVAMALALAVIGIRLIDLQALGNDRYDRLARSQLRNVATLSAVRGAIFDRNGRDLALSVRRPTIFVDPSLVQDPVRAARALAPVLGQSEASILATISTPNSQFEYLSRRVEPAVARTVAALELRGIGEVPESARVYPGDTLAGPVLGWVGSDNQGLGGLEAKYEELLRGTPGSLQVEKDPSGREIPATERHEIAAQPGGDLVLTIDQTLQFEVEQRLTAEVQKVKAAGGVAVVVDIRTGDILAMANVKGADDRTGPARPAPATAPNASVTEVHEPGSTAKVMTMAAALEYDVIDFNTRFSVPASISVGGAKFDDDQPHGTADWTVREILAKSSNVGTIMIAKDVGRQRLDLMMRKFGLGARTDIGFPGEQRGLLQGPTQIDPAIMGSLPVGYGIASTAVQTLGVFTTVANRGMSRPARLVAATIDANGERHQNRSMPARRVISETTAAELTDLLGEVVRTGTGVKAAIPGYAVAGKTGTARKHPYEKPYRYLASFGGFAPADAPRLAAVVVLDEPQTEVYGGAVAAPVFSAIMRFALRMEHIAPRDPAGADAGSTINARVTDRVPAPVP